MYTHEMLFFGGSVLGPALVAQALQDVLATVPELNATQPPAGPEADDVDRLLSSAFPHGLSL